MATAPTTVDRPTETQRVYNLALEKEFLKKLYEVTEINKEFVTSQKIMAEVTGVPTNIVNSVMRVMRKNGLYRVRFNYNPNGASTGREAFWTIDKPYEVAYHALMSDQQSRQDRITRRNQHISAAMKARRMATITAAPIAVNGNALSQAKVWAKSAKAYMHQIDRVTTMIEELKSSGLDVDEAAIYAAVNLKQDEKLGTIALVIPYIDFLEKALRDAQKRFQQG